MTEEQKTYQELCNYICTGQITEFNQLIQTPIQSGRRFNIDYQPPSPSTNDTLLIIAARNNIDFVPIVLSYEPDANLSNRFGETAFSVLAENYIRNKNGANTKEKILMDMRLLLDVQAEPFFNSPIPENMTLEQQKRLEELNGFLFSYEEEQCEPVGARSNTYWDEYWEDSRIGM